MKNLVKIKNIKKKITPILKHHDVKRAAIFGSYARGEQKKKSDVDILIEYKRNDKSLFDLIDLEFELKEKLNRKVDVVTYDSFHPLLRESILKDQSVIL